MTTLGSFIRDTAYFQIRRDQQLMLNAEDFDLQFTNLINYINGKITPLINRLESQVVPGTDEEGTENTFLRNIGDGTTEWVSINNNAINDYSIGYSKLIQAITGSIFATANDRIFKIVTPTEDGQLLSSTSDNLPIWQKTKGDNFEDRTINGTNIDFACIGIEHLSPEIIGRPLDNNVILTRHILDLSIPGSKFGDNSITTPKIDQELITEKETNINSINYRFLDNSLENRHFPNNFLDNTVLQIRTNGVDSGFGDDNINYTFTPNMIPDNSIDIPTGVPPGTINIPTTRCFANGSIEPKHITLNSTRFSMVGFVGFPKIRKEKLNAQIRQKLGI